MPLDLGPCPACGLAVETRVGAKYEIRTWVDHDKGGKSSVFTERTGRWMHGVCARLRKLDVMPGQLSIDDALEGTR